MWYISTILLFFNATVLVQLKSWHKFIVSINFHLVFLFICEFKYGILPCISTHKLNKTAINYTLEPSTSLHNLH